MFMSAGGGNQKGTGDRPVGVERGRERESEEGDRGWEEREKSRKRKE